VQALPNFQAPLNAAIIRNIFLGRKRLAKNKEGLT